MKAMIVATLLAVPFLQDGKVDLRWKFQKGQQLWYQVTQSTTIDMAGMTMEQSNRTTYSHSVADVDEAGTATLNVKYEAVAAKATGIQEYDFDSEKQKEPDTDNPTVRMLSRMVGQSFTLKMGPNGKVREVKGFDKIFEALFKGLEDDPQMQMARQMLKQSYSDEAIQSMMQQMYMPLPEGAVEKGDSWKTDLTIQLPFVGKSSLSGTCRLADLQGPDAHLEQEWKMGTKEEGEDKENNPLAGMIQISGMKGKSKGVFSLERGLFLSTRTDSTMVMVSGGQEMELRSVNENRLLDRKPGERKDY